MPKPAANSGPHGVKARERWTQVHIQRPGRSRDKSAISPCNWVATVSYSPMMGCIHTATGWYMPLLVYVPFYRGTLQLAVELKKLHQSPVHKASRLKVAQTHAQVTAVEGFQSMDPRRN